MGQQQLLFIVLGVIVVGAAVFFSISLFKAEAVNSKRDLVMNECATLGNMALQYYNKPSTYGGGGFSFTDWQVPSQLAATASGTYVATISSMQVVIIGTGNEVVNGTDSVKIKTIVEPKSVTSIILN